MADTDIEWADKVWNFLVGCSRTTADPSLPSGCDNCYAIAEVARERCEQHKGLTKIRPASSSRPGPDWNGEVNVVPHKLSEPLHWRKPVRVFVNSVSDLFHARVPFELIAAAFGVMAACPQHTFLVLTKRPERAHEFFAWLASHSTATPHLVCWGAARKLGIDLPSSGPVVPWPLPNVHLGVSAEHQAAANVRIPTLFQCPAALYWVSYEPALGPIDFHAIQIPEEREGLRFSALQRQHDDRFGASDKTLGWVVIGGESGHRARPCQVTWIRNAVQQLVASGVPPFVKQMGAVVIDRNDAHFDYTGAEDEDGRGWPDTVTPDDVIDDPNGFREQHQGAPVRILLRDKDRKLDKKGKTMALWPRDLRVRELPTP